jgi:hypothetical protein
MPTAREQLHQWLDEPEGASAELKEAKQTRRAEIGGGFAPNPAVGAYAVYNSVQT